MLGRGRECSRRLIATNLQSTIRDLQRRKARGRRGLALIEGVRLVEEALAAGLPFRGAVVAPELSHSSRIPTRRRASLPWWSPGGGRPAIWRSARRESRS